MGRMTINVPVTKDTHQHLSNYDADDFHIINRINPDGITGFGVFPALDEDCLEQRLDVTDREEDVTV